MIISRPARGPLVRASAALALLAALGPAAGRLPSVAAPSPAGSVDAVGPSRHRVVGLGDSVVSGSHCRCAPFVARYADLMARRTDSVVGAHNLGVPGLTTAGLLAQLARSDAVAVVRRADLVTVTIGANDMVAARRSWQSGTCDSCFVVAAASVRRGTRAVLRRIAELRGGRRTEVLVTTYWNVFEEATEGDGHPRGYRAMAQRATRRANDAICDAATAAGVACIDLYGPFKGNGRDPSPLLAADGDHPSSAGHAVIAAALARHGWRELGLPR